ncbi:MAG: hypothetical protein GF331_18445 [Chitinivibrionales bacterium]|nr:hypothetical protein [Chitinivibrionales bacterium]
MRKVLERSRIRGTMARCEYAEGFKTALTVNDRRWERKAGSLLLDL